MNYTKSRIDAKGILLRIEVLENELYHLQQVQGISKDSLALRYNEILRLREQYNTLHSKARLEDLRVFQTTQKVIRKSGVKQYLQWQAAWRVNGKTKTVYLGRVSKLSESEATRIARNLKAKSLGLEESLPTTKPVIYKQKVPTLQKIELTNMVLPKKPEIGRGIVGEEAT